MSCPYNVRLPFCCPAVPRRAFPMSIERLRNIAIVAHVDHGKTTPVDCLLKQSGTFSERTLLADRGLDSNAPEKERRIPPLPTNTTITRSAHQHTPADPTHQH